MKIEYPGLIKQTLPSGIVVYRVRPQGAHSKRIQIAGNLGDEEFIRQYWLARAGKKPDAEKKPSEQEKPNSIGWLVRSYFEYLEARVSAGTTSAKTLKKKRNLLTKLIKNPNKTMLIPRERLILFQDETAVSNGRGRQQRTRSAAPISMLMSGSPF